MISIGASAPTTPREFTSDTEACAARVGRQITAIIKQIQTEVAPTRSKDKVNTNLDLLSKDITTYENHLKAEQLADLAGFEASRRAFLKYLEWHRETVIPRLRQAADIALSSSMSPEEKKQEINGMLFGIVREDKALREDYLRAVKTIHPAGSSEAQQDKTRSADYQLGAVFVTIMLIVLVPVLIIVLLLKLARRSPEYHLRRARQAALQQSHPNHNDPF